MRPKPLAIVSQIKSNASVVWGLDSVSEQREGEASSEKAPVGRVIESDAGVSNELLLWRGFLRPVCS